MAGDTSILDSLQPIQPTPGMASAGMAAAQKAQPGAVPSMTIRPQPQTGGGTSILDALPPIQDTPGMMLAKGIGYPGMPQGKGIAANVAAGANKAIFGALGAPVDLTAGAMNLVPRGINAATGSHIPTIQNPPGGSQWLGQQFGKVSVDPNTVQPVGEAERIAQGVGGAVAQVPAMALGGAATAPFLSEGMAGGVASAVRSSAGETGPAAALTATAAGAGGGLGQGAEDAAPEPLKPLASLGGNLAGAAGITGIFRGVQGAGGLIARKAGEAGIGSKQDFNGARATAAQANKTGATLAEQMGPQGQQNVERAVDTEQQARDLETTLADPQTSPVDRAAAQQQLQAIQGRRVNLVPGSSPTTAQVAQTAGASNLERQARLTNGPQFEELAKQQNNARVAAIQGLEPTGASPASVGELFTQHLNALDQRGQQSIGQLAGVRNAAVEASGGAAPTGTYGGQIREMLQTAEEPVHAAASRAFQAVDPDGAWTIQSAPLRTIADGLAQGVSPTAKTDAQTNALLARGQTQPAVIPFSSLSEMRADANDALKRLMRSGDAPSEVRRLTLFKQGIDQTISQAVNSHAGTDPALAARLGAEIGGQSNGAANGGVGAGQPAAGAAPGPGQPLGGPGPRAAGSGGAAGTGSLADEAAAWQRARTTGQPAASAAPVVANVGAEEAGRYQNAIARWRDYMQRYHQGGVGDVLARNDQGWKTQEGNVPAKIFTGGPTEPAQAGHFIEAVGGPENAAEIGRNVLANDLRTKGIIKPDGTVDANRLSLWQRNREGTLHQFPGLADHFSSLEAAQRTVDSVTAAHKADIDRFNKSAAANFIHDDPLRAVGKAFQSSNPTATFAGLARGVRGSPEAQAGLKRAVVDYITQRFRSATPSSDGIDFLQPGGFRKWVDTNKGPLRALFGGQGVQNLNMVAADMRRAAEGPKAISGSQTTPLMANAKRLGASVAHHGATGMISMLALLGEHLGESVGAHGLLGAGAAAGGGMLLNALHQSGIHTMADLTAEAMLHPQLARTLMAQSDASRALSAASQRRMATAFQGALLADMASTPSGDQRQ